MAGVDYTYHLFENNKEVGVDMIPDFPFYAEKCGFYYERGAFSLMSDYSMESGQIMWSQAEGWDVFAKYIYDNNGRGTYIVAYKGSRIVLGVSAYLYHEKDSKFFLKKLQKFNHWITKSFTRIMQNG